MNLESPFASITSKVGEKMEIFCLKIDSFSFQELQLVSYIVSLNLANDLPRGSFDDHWLVETRAANQIVASQRPFHGHYEVVLFAKSDQIFINILLHKTWSLFAFGSLMSIRNPWSCSQHCLKIFEPWIEYLKLTFSHQWREGPPWRPFQWPTCNNPGNVENRFFIGLIFKKYVKNCT